MTNTNSIQHQAPPTVLDCGKVRIVWAAEADTFTVRNSTDDIPLTQDGLDAAAGPLDGRQREMLSFALAVAYDLPTRENGVTEDTVLGSDGRTDAAELGSDEDVRIQVRPAGTGGAEVVVVKTAMTRRAARRAARYRKQQVRDSACRIRVRHDGSVKLLRGKASRRQR